MSTRNYKIQAAGHRATGKVFRRRFTSERTMRAWAQRTSSRIEHSSRIGVMHPVLVYGSLKRGFYNHHCLVPKLAGAAQFVREDTVSGVMYNLGMFPALAKGERTYKGELFMVDDIVLRRLDSLEGHPNFYRREMTRMGSGESAWVYYIVDVSRYSAVPKVVGDTWLENKRIPDQEQV